MTEQQVHEALNNLSSASDIRVELRLCESIEEGLLATFASVGCGCSKKCSSQFSLSYIRDMRAQCYDLSHNELDLILLGQLVASTNTSEVVVVESGHLGKERKKAYQSYHHAGKIVCGNTFRFLHTIGRKRLKNHAKSLRENGHTPCTHGNAHELPKHSLSFESTEFVVRFLLNYAEQNALLPGIVPGYSRSDIKLLPSSVLKRGIWKTYHSAADEESSIHAVAFTTFCHLWRSLLPSVIIMKPMTDLCWTCHQNSIAILRAANCSEANKSITIKEAEEHLHIVQIERSFCKSTCDACRESVRAHFTVNGEFTPPALSSNITPNTNDIQVHYSFDHAQHVHFPSDPLQPGPIYFLMPRKCTVFGVNCEVLLRQVNFLTDEAGECGKGANNVVSQLHFFLETHRLGEKVAFLHADNCTGQNKNNCMMQILSSV